VFNEGKDPFIHFILPSILCPGRAAGVKKNFHSKFLFFQQEYVR